MKKTPLEIGKEAAEYARKTVIAESKRAHLTLRRTLTRIAEGLNATETKASYDKDRGKWVYSDPMIDWGARAKAIDQAIAILDLKPAEKHEVELNIKPLVIVNDASAAKDAA